MTWKSRNHHLFDDYSGRSPASAQHAMGTDHISEKRLMLSYASKFTTEQFKQFDNAFRPKNEAFIKTKVTVGITRWHYQRYIKNYLSCVKAVDENIGRMLDFLDKSKLSENTIVIYSSDQGFWLGEHGWFDKRWMYEESLHTPYLSAGQIWSSLQVKMNYWFQRISPLSGTCRNWTR